MLSSTSLQQIISVLPPGIKSYASLHLDTIPKLLNHILIMMFFSNFALFMMCLKNKSHAHTSGNGSAVQVANADDGTITMSGLPADMSLGFLNTLSSSMLLLVQNVIVYIAINDLGNVLFGSSRSNNNINLHSMLSPNEYMIGVCLGITIGGCILAYTITHYYHQVNAFCNQLRRDNRGMARVSTQNLFTNQFGDDDDDDNKRYLTGNDANLLLSGDICSDNHGKHKNGNLYWIAFWSGLVFWWNFCLILIMAIGKSELIRFSASTSSSSSANNQTYESVPSDSLGAGGGGGNNGTMGGTGNGGSFQQYNTNNAPTTQQQQTQQPQQQETFTGDYSTPISAYSDTAASPMVVAYSDKINITHG